MLRSVLKWAVSLFNWISKWNLKILSLNYPMLLNITSLIIRRWDEYTLKLAVFFEMLMGLAKLSCDLSDGYDKLYYVHLFCSFHPRFCSTSTCCVIMGRQTCLDGESNQCINSKHEMSNLQFFWYNSHINDLI